MHRQESAGALGVIDAFDVATRAIAGLLSVDDALQVIVDQVRPLLGARYAALGIVGSDGRMERFITSGISAYERAMIGPIPEGHGLLGMIVTENRAMRIADINVDPRRHGFPPHHPPMHSLLGVPIAVQGRSVGNLYLTDKLDAPEFTGQDQRLLETFAVHAGIAIENARLHEQVQRLAVVDERDRISKDLHDGIIQNLYAVGLSLEDVPDLIGEDPDEVERRVEAAITSLHLTIRDIRNLIFGLRPELLTGVSLLTGLAVTVDEFRRHSIIDVELDATEPVEEPEQSVTAHLLGMANEALSNVGRHSGATRAVIRLAVDIAGDLRLEIEDNGHGFDATAPGVMGHQGMVNMRSRATAIGATMDIRSDDHGTTIIIRRPNAAAADPEEPVR